MTYAAAAAWLRPRLWLGWAAGAAIWSVWLGSLALGGWDHDAEGQLLFADHIAFYSAARLIVDGRQGEVYTPEAIGRVQQEVTAGTWEGYFMAYRNPPFYALLYTPTARLSLPISALVWTGVSVLAFGLSVWLIAPACTWRAVAWSFAFYPVFATISFGQNTLLSLLAFAAAYRLLTGGRLFAAGLAAGLLWYKPQLLIGLMLWWGLEPVRYRRCWLGLLTTGAGLAAVSWVVLPEASAAFVETLGKNLAYGGERGWNKHSTRAFWSLLLPWAGPATVWGLTAASAAAGLTAAWLAARRCNWSPPALFAVTVPLTLWLSPHVLIYEWALLVLPAVVVWDRRRPADADAWLGLYALAWGALGVSTTLALVQERHLREWAEARWGVAAPVLQVSIPVLAMVGALAVRRLRPTAAAPPGA